MCKFESSQKDESRVHSNDSSYAGIDNLSRVAGQKQTLQGMAGRNNFLPMIPFSLLLLNLGKLWNLNQVNSCAMRFLIRVPRKYSIQEVGRRVNS